MDPQYIGREGRRTGSGRYEIRHLYVVGNQHFWSHKKGEALRLALEYVTKSAATFHGNHEVSRENHR